MSEAPKICAAPRKALRRAVGQREARGVRTLCLETDLDPARDEVSAILERVRALDRAGQGARASVVVATIDARSHRGQLRLLEAPASTGLPTIAVVLRSPRDAAVVPHTASVLCAYAIQPPTIEALAAALYGEATCPGRLPVALPRFEA